MKLTLCLIAAAYLVIDLCNWHGPIDAAAARWSDEWHHVAARVHGVAITAEDVEHASQERAFLHGQDWRNMPEASRIEARKQSLSQLIDAALVRYARQQADHPAAGLQEELRLFIKQFPSDTDYPERLPLQHLNEPLLRARMQGCLDDQAWLESQIASKLTAVTDSFAEAWYASHTTDFAVPETFRAAHIFLGDHEKDPKDDPNREPDIRRLYARLTSGTSFEQLAAEASDDERSKLRSGDLGWFSRSRMPEDFMTALTALKPGEISPPVHTHLGWHIIKLIEKKPARIPAFKEVSHEVIEALRNQERTKAIRAVLDNLRLQYAEGQPSHTSNER